MGWFGRKKPRSDDVRSGVPRGRSSSEIASDYDRMRALARSGLDREWELIVQEMFHAEVDAVENEWMPAPASFKRGAVSLRKQKRYATEVQVLERFKGLTETYRGGQSLYTVSAELYQRLEKAKALRDSQKNRPEP